METVSSKSVGFGFDKPVKAYRCSYRILSIPCLTSFLLCRSRFFREAGDTIYFSTCGGREKDSTIARVLASFSGSISEYEGNFLRRVSRVEREAGVMQLLESRSDIALDNSPALT